MKYRSLATLQVGEELGEIEYIVEPKVVKLFMIAINDRHPWYYEKSPFGGAIAPPCLIHQYTLRLTAKYIFGDERKIPFLPKPMMHYVYDAEYVNPAMVGEKLTVRGRCIENDERRGRVYNTLGIEVFGTDKRPIVRYKHTRVLNTKKEG